MTTSQERTCEDCGTKYKTEVCTFQAGFGNPRKFFNPRCPACIEKLRIEAEAKQIERERESRTRAWLNICPPEYRRCDREKLPDAGRVALDKALTWKPDMGGLGLVGRTSGEGKTRIAYAIAKPLYLNGKSVAATGCVQLGVECATRFDSQLGEILKPLRNSSILILDDMGKERANERFATILFSIIEHRTSHQKPILYTTNYSAEELETHFGEHGPYLVRRLRDYTSTIML
jgi:hypothetical protein